MAPSLKGKRKKKSVPMAESESQEVPVLCPEEEHQDNPEKLEEAVSPSDKQDSTSEAEQKPPEDDSGDEEMLIGEKEEEQTFLVNLYKFMKERHTPIERVPHLGFKQINLFKIYKAVEKLGAYELVTGRRLWKNVYDMLGGSPGSTSAATCTRRHYERLVLPYVRHLKGEDDKPLPPVKPRKQYKISKEPKGDRVAEKKRTKKEKMRDPSLPEKVRPDVALISKLPNVTEPIQPREQTEGHLSLPNSREMAETLPAASCLGNCQSHGCSEAYTRLFSSFYFKGNNGIMSPLAKKKLLAQVSQDECLYAHEKKHLSHCPEYKKIRIREIPGLDSEVGRLQKEAPKTGAEVNGSSSSPGPSQVGKTNEGLMKVPPGFKEGPGSMKGEEESSGAHLSTGPPVFRGYFHTTSSSTILKPVSGLRGPVEYYSSLKDLSVTSPAYSKPGKDALVAAGSQKKQESLEDQPEDLRRKPSQPWKADHQRSSAFQASTLSTKAGSPPFQPVKASWVPPVVNLAKVSPQVSKNGGPSVSPGQANISVQKKRASEEDYFLHGKKLKAVSPFVKEVDSSSSLDQGTSPGGQPGIAKPKATVAGSRFPVAHVPQIQDMYKGTMLRLPVNFSSPGEHLKEQAPSLIQSLSINPFIIPAFPTPLLTASIQPSDLGQSLGASLVHYPTSYDSALRHRLYPVSTWHSQPTYASAHVPSYHRNTKL